MSRAYSFELSSQLAAPAAQVWAHAASMRGVNRELFPLARMTHPRELAVIEPGRVPLGQRAFRSWILALGVVPIDYDDLTIVALEPGRRFLERSPMFTQREWQHERVVEPAAGGSIVTDRVHFVPRVAALGPLFRLVFRLAFRLRHRNLRRIFGARERRGESGCGVRRRYRPAIRRVGMKFSADQWAVILGGSSGFGLATAKRLGALGMSVCVVHRDRRAMLAKIEPEFEKIRAGGTRLITMNTDALDAESRREVVDALAAEMGRGRVRVLLHSVAFGNLKLLVAESKRGSSAARELAGKLGVDQDKLQSALDEMFAAGHPQALGLASAPAYSDKHFLDEEDFSRTIHAMGTSLLGWVQELFQRGLFAADARVFGLTSEGNEVAWKGYAAVAAAKVSLESLARSIAVEFAPYGIRCNVIQAGITHTPAQDAIPGSAHMRAQALSRNPMGRLTTPEDVANVIGLLASDEAGWINGEVIRVDGGEHISGASS